MKSVGCWMSAEGVALNVSFSESKDKSRRSFHAALIPVRSDSSLHTGYAMCSSCRTENSEQRVGSCCRLVSMRDGTRKCLACGVKAKVGSHREMREG